jgi:type IV pilus assembly protein PilC
MARYSYEARTLTGNAQKGVIEAKDEAEARVKLRAKQLIPMKFTVLQGAVGGQKANSASVSFFTPKVKTKELQIFTRQFATLINAGIPILDALKILSQGGTDKLIKEAVIQVSASIESGKRLSESLSMHPRVFDSLYCNMVKAGEEAGILDVILLRLSTYAEKSEKIKGQIKSALTMPVFIMIAAILVITGIIVFIIPKFEEIYKSSGKELPGLTQTVVNISGLVRNHWMFIIVGIFVAIYGIIMYLNTEDGKRNFDKMIINAPLIGDVIQKVSVARMSRTMSTLLSSGINMLEAIDIASKTAGNYVIEQALKNCKDAVTVGKPFNVPLSRQKEIPQMVAQMVSIGEQSGSLDTMLGKVADFYEEEVESSIRGMTSLIEPIMMVGLGGMIAFILVAMYLPIFQLGDTIG